jgi:hypothetical protein
MLQHVVLPFCQVASNDVLWLLRYFRSNCLLKPGPLTSHAPDGRRSRHEAEAAPPSTLGRPLLPRLGSSQAGPPHTLGLLGHVGRASGGRADHTPRWNNQSWPRALSLGAIRRRPLGGTPVGLGEFANWWLRLPATLCTALRPNARGGIVGPAYSGESCRRSRQPRSCRSAEHPQRRVVAVNLAPSRGWNPPHRVPRRLVPRPLH